MSRFICSTCEEITEGNDPCRCGRSADRVERSRTERRPLPARRLHFSVRRGTSSPDGRPVLAFGLRVGYWPCLLAPFIEVACGPYRIDLWHGLPTYQVQP